MNKLVLKSFFLSFFILSACASEPVSQSEPLSKSWTKLQYFMSWGPCRMPGKCSSSWYISSSHPDTLVINNKEKVPISLSDSKKIQNIINSSGFQTKIKNGFNCKLPPTDNFHELRLKYSDDSILNQTVTGCAFDERNQTYPKILNETISKYLK